VIPWGTTSFGYGEFIDGNAAMAFYREEVVPQRPPAHPEEAPLPNDVLPPLVS
jgi:hypothetical protein